MGSPRNLHDFCLMGEACPSDGWMYKLWERAWLNQDSSITSRVVERDRFPITLDPQNCIPSHHLVMERCHSDEFALFQISHVYVREAYIRLAQTIITLYGGDSSMTTGVFTNPFAGFKTEKQKAVIVSGSPGNCMFIIILLFPTIYPGSSGATIFLYFLLRCRLQAQLPTILQLCSEGFFLFTEFGVHALPESPFDWTNAPDLHRIAPDLWCLVDSNPYNPIPSDFIRSSMLSIIQSASMRRPEIRWANKCELHTRTYFMPPFTLQESIVAYVLQFLSTFKLLDSHTPHIAVPCS
jgi:hypothetical protein